MRYVIIIKYKNIQKISQFQKTTKFFFQKVFQKYFENFDFANIFGKCSFQTIIFTKFFQSFSKIIFPKCFEIFLENQNFLVSSRFYWSRCGY